jgi:hypothetical protein
MVPAAMRKSQPLATDNLRHASALAAAKQRASHARIAAQRADRAMSLMIDKWWARRCSRRTVSRRRRRGPRFGGFAHARGDGGQARMARRPNAVLGPPASGPERRAQGPSGAAPPVWLGIRCRSTRCFSPRRGGRGRRDLPRLGPTRGWRCTWTAFGPRPCPPPMLSKRRWRQKCIGASRLCSRCRRRSVKGRYG